MKMNFKDFARKYHNIELPSHQVRWLKFLSRKGRRKIILAPRGHGKTTIVNLIYVSWLIAHNPKLHILIVSHSRETAEDFSRSVRAVFEREDILEDFDLYQGSPWRANSWTLKGSQGSKPTLKVIGAMGKMTGWRGDIVIFDDLLEIKGVATEATRNKINNWIYGEIIPALNPGKNEQVIVVGTRKHVHDWYGELLNNSEYLIKTDKAIKKNGHVL